MKRIPLTRGKFALVDDEDYGRVAPFKWSALKNKDKWYAVRSAPRKNGKQSAIYMHRVILGAKPGQQVDHKDGNGLDNRRRGKTGNIRIARRGGNQQNRRKGRNNTSGFKGVVRTFSSGKNNRWRAQIGVNGELYCIGLYFTKSEAAKAYDEAARKYHGEFASLNFAAVDNIANQPVD